MRKTALKVMLHGTIRKNDFYRNPALQCCNNVVTIQNNVATILQQCCNAVLRYESSLRIVSSNTLEWPISNCRMCGQI